MNHFILFSLCLVSVEVFLRFNFLGILNLILETTKKVLRVIPQKKISDHWKEKIIPTYALILMKHSSQIILILFTIISFFFIMDFLLNDFIVFALSIVGIIESILFVSVYLFLRKLFVQ